MVTTTLNLTIWLSVNVHKCLSLFGMRLINGRIQIGRLLDGAKGVRFMAINEVG